MVGRAERMRLENWEVLHLLILLTLLLVPPVYSINDAEFGRGDVCGCSALQISAPSAPATASGCLYVPGDGGQAALWWFCGCRCGCLRHQPEYSGPISTFCANLHIGRHFTYMLTTD